ncbi:hypothetical protein ETU08_02940 [Apibacter muscae]|uniref:Uncharacterized protein n=1 Tax=Apibacter muscae TaxID=2509004 RepID=A0A563DIB6_9FLAO|nr:hypothetical protein [Apibacter muscae]TWP29829.1 hypothetical protein ETU09_02290 [Apibacter muscae]TWP30977.1 hypothetical protein ETU08_02940 [Apibacter muscae]
MIGKKIIVILITIGVLFQTPHLLAHGIHGLNKNFSNNSKTHSCCRDKCNHHNKQNCKETKNKKNCCDILCAPSFIKLQLFFNEPSIEKYNLNKTYLPLIKFNTFFTYQSYTSVNWVPPQFI